MSISSGKDPGTPFCSTSLGGEWVPFQAKSPAEDNQPFHVTFNDIQENEDNAEGSQL